VARGFWLVVGGWVVPGRRHNNAPDSDRRQVFLGSAGPIIVSDIDRGGMKLFPESVCGAVAIGGSREKDAEPVLDFFDRRRVEVVNLGEEQFDLRAGFDVDGGPRLQIFNRTCL
jgi:hypothetical protein